MSTIPAAEVFEEWMKDPEYRAEYEASQPAFDLMRALLRARVSSGLTQTEVAERMGTTQSAIARLEGWSANPSVSTLRKYAEATGTRLSIGFEEIEAENPDTQDDSTSTNGADVQSLADVDETVSIAT